MLIGKYYPLYKYSHHSIFRDASCVQRILMLHLSFQNPNFISRMWNANLSSSVREICFHVFEKQSNFLWMVGMCKYYIISTYKYISPGKVWGNFVKSSIVSVMRSICLLSKLLTGYFHHKNAYTHKGRKAAEILIWTSKGLVQGARKQVHIHLLTGKDQICVWSSCIMTLFCLFSWVPCLLGILLWEVASPSLK